MPSATSKPGTKPPASVPRENGSWLWLSGLVLLAGLGLSVWEYRSLEQQRRRADEARFDALVHEAESAIGQRLAVYENALRGGQTLFTLAPVINRENWKIFVDSMGMAKRFPGIRGMGFVFAVDPNDAAGFVARIRADGRPNFFLRRFGGRGATSEGENPLYVITYREPEVASDSGTFGVNLANDLNRRETLERARDTGSPVLTRKTYLVFDDTKRPAFVLYAPLYRSGVPVETVEQRRQAIRGWLFASFIAEDLLEPILDAGGKELALCLFEGEKPPAELAPIVSNVAGARPSAFERVDALELAGRMFSFGWNRSTHFVSPSRVSSERAVAASSVAAVLLAALVASLLYSRREAHQKIARQDAELALQKFAMDQHAIVAITDAEGIITYANDKFCEVSGHSREELLGKNHRILKSGVHPPQFFKQLYETITQGKVWQGEICNRKKNGELYWMSATIVPFLGPDGRPEKYVAIRTDMTAQKRAEEKIAERERLIRAVTDGLPGLIAYWTADLRCTFANRAYREWFGIDSEKILDLSLNDVLGEELLRANEHHVHAALKGETQSFERTIQKADGGVGFTWAQYVPDFGSDGTTVKGFFVLVSDVTEVKVKEEALRATAQRLQLAAAIAQIGVWEWNLGNNHMQADERMFELYGFKWSPDGHFPFSVWQQGVIPEDRPAQMVHLNETIKTGGRSRRQFRIRRQNDGALRYIESEEQVEADKTGKAVRIVGVNRDITEIVQAEAALLESEARTRLFAEHAPAAVAMFDREMRYLVVSKQWMTDNKLGEVSVIGRSHYDLFPNTPERWRGIHRRCLNGAVEMAQSEQLQLADGSTRWVQWEARPWYSPGGEIGGIVMFTLDITERYELEARLEKARDDALSASRLKSEFLATMSHEIRTPMNGVIGIAGLLLETPLEARQRELTQSLLRSAERLMVIINDILDFSKIEAGKMRIEPVDFNLRDVIEETAALMAAPAHHKGLHFTCDIDPVLATGFCGDSGRIQQILANLVGNAVKFTREGSIAVSVNALRSNDSEVAFRIDVSDTGIGIPTAARENLFQPFVQVDGSTTRRFGGTGLGLAICSQLVGIMGGRIGFDSVEGRGSTFWVELCLPRAKLPEIEICDRIPRGARVLVIDDHEVNRMVVLRQLAAMEVSAGAVASGADGLETLSREAANGRPFNVVLLDWSMPQMDGQKLARAIRENPKIANTCLIALSSTSETIESSVTAELKIHAVLTMPVREAQLRRCLLRVYGRKPTPTPFSSREAPEGRGLRLLLAEDNETNQLVARMMLEKFGHSIEVAENGLAALEWLATERFDAVLMDCQMPGMDGYETTRQIRAGKAHGTNPNIPIIAITAHAMPTDRARAIAAGMDDYVSKPLSKESVHAALARCGLIDPIENERDPVPELPRTQAAEMVFDQTQRDKLQALRAPGGGTVWEKARGVFLERMPERLSLLAAHAADRRSEDLASLAHMIAGSSASMGAPALRATGLALETAAQKGEWDQVPALVAAMERNWHALEAELLKDDKS